MDSAAADLGGDAVPTGRPLTLLGSSNAAVTLDLRKHAVFHTLKVKAAQLLWARHLASHSNALPACFFSSNAPAKSVLVKRLKVPFDVRFVFGAAIGMPSLCKPSVATGSPGRRARTSRKSAAAPSLLPC